jgi:hypothetical protein
MASTITFTDAIGAATLKNGKPVPGDRFSAWTLRSVPVGDFAHRQSDGALSRFKVRDDYGVSFELRAIPVRTTGGVRLVDIADRLVYHLLNGGTCTVNTGDTASSSYATLGLMPGTEPQLTLSDPRMLEYTLAVSLINLAGSPVRLVCYYDA